MADSGLVPRARLLHARLPDVRRWPLMVGLLQLASGVGVLICLDGLLSMFRKLVI